jgi:hypothetical protein
MCRRKIQRSCENILEKLNVIQYRCRFGRKRLENFVSGGFKYPLDLVLVCVKKKKWEKDFNESQNIMLVFDNSYDA